MIGIEDCVCAAGAILISLAMGGGIFLLENETRCDSACSLPLLYRATVRVDMLS